MSQDTLFARIVADESRPNPYPLYAIMRKTPVARQADGTFVVSSYDAIYRLLYDPRLSSEDLPPPLLFHWTGNPIKDLIVDPIKEQIRARHRPFIFRDPPDHDALRRHVMHEFSPERVRAMRGKTEKITHELIDNCRSRDQIDLVDDFSYPLPVTVICELLGVPREDEPQFQGWATQLATALDPDQRSDEKNWKKSQITFDAISAYMQALIDRKRADPEEDMLSGLATYKDPSDARMNDYDLISTAILLLVAGHETTVNLITNGMLTLLRHPEHLERLRATPAIAPRLVEELLRYEPPVHYRTRLALAEIEIGGVKIPKGSPVVLLLAAGSRDPDRFPDPDRFDPDREGNAHFGFGGSLHYCVGAPLARIEGEVALVALARRLRNPRLVEAIPPYRPGASLRGPCHLPIAIDGIIDWGG